MLEQHFSQITGSACLEAVVYTRLVGPSSQAIRTPPAEHLVSSGQCEQIWPLRYVLILVRTNEAYLSLDN